MLHLDASAWHHRDAAPEAADDDGWTDQVTERVVLLSVVQRGRDAEGGHTVTLTVY